MEKNARIFVAGAETLIGAAILSQLKQQGYQNLVGNEADLKIDLSDRVQVEALFAQYKPDYVFLAAGKSGGIQANQKYPADLMLDNLLIVSHVIHQSYCHQVKKLLYLASSCSYPKHCAQPMQVSSLWTGVLEPTNEAYAVAKLAGITLCQSYHQQYGANFITAIPANAFGVGDDFSLEDSHVIPALIRKFHEAKVSKSDRVEIWGTGTPRREFIFADDLADACLFVMAHYNDARPINLGGGEDVSIRQLATLIQSVVGFEGELSFDPTKPDGMPLKALDATELCEMGWKSQTSLQDAISSTYAYFLQSNREVAYV
ncbi:GDP-L-fucose synthase [Tumidithrix elongata RA019]|uniref:GDP-L-fucose synthase n=1 Tax=Tumidithrix elongata BACA0141 TaxID=2716417 RepID=A0AAW9PPD9_9CYAN|nr:GDP-L-fucose synthase [Tumidithrix elongata RA019]